MNQPSDSCYVIRLPDGRCLGCYSIHGGIVPVPPVFAHLFTDLAEAQAHLGHARTAMGFAEAELVPISECPEPRIDAEFAFTNSSL